MMIFGQALLAHVGTLACIYTYWGWHKHCMQMSGMIKCIGFHLPLLRLGLADEIVH